jgi:hypothetical protein
MFEFNPFSARISNGNFAKNDLPFAYMNGITDAG